MIARRPGEDRITSPGLCSAEQRVRMGRATLVRRPASGACAEQVCSALCTQRMCQRAALVPDDPAARSPRRPDVDPGMPSTGEDVGAAVARSPAGPRTAGLSLALPGGIGSSSCPGEDAPIWVVAGVRPLETSAWIATGALVVQLGAATTVRTSGSPNPAISAGIDGLFHPLCTRRATLKCRCEPQAQPVLPEYPINSPAFTFCPASTVTEEKCRY